MAQTWDVLLFTFVPAAGYGDNLSSGYGAAGSVHAWSITLLTEQPAAGYGNSTSEGYGNIGGGHAWSIVLVDGSVVGYGESTSSGYGSGTAISYLTYSLTGTVVYSDIFIYTTLRSSIQVNATRKAVPATLTSTAEVPATVVSSAPRTNVVTVQPDFSIVISTFAPLT